MRDYDEISDEEWDRHSFKLSRALKKRKRDGEDFHENRNGRTLPQIESFAFNKTKADSTASSSANDVDDNDDDFKNGSRNANSSRLSKFKSTENRTTSSSPIQNLEDDDFDFGRNKARGSRSRRLIVEDDSDDDRNRVKEAGTSSRTTLEMVDIDNESVQESPKEYDVVGNALQKCYKISAALRHKLYGSSLIPSSINEGYSEVNDSAAKIVTQDDVTAACASEDSKFVPILKPYQLVGVNFLLLLHRNNIGGAILADEMGLGKTVQAITYLTLLKHLDNEPGPHLVVCPASVLENWERELQRWCPSFSILQYHGAGRAAYSKELNSLSKAGLPPPFDVLLVCYSLFERHSLQQKDDRKVLKRWKWSCVLMDEAHVLKDRNSYRRKNLLQVAKHANQRLMLTGTPLQNDLLELWSLLEFMMPDIFETGDVDLKKLLNAEDKDLIARIKSILGPFVLRRLKKDVMQQLVPKEQRVECVTMGNEQDTAYRDSISEYRAASLARSTKTSESVKSTVGSLPRRQLSNYFTQFRKVANHPLLIRRIYSDKDVIHLAKELHPKGIFGFECTLDRVISELKSYSDFALHRLLVSYGGCASTRGPLQKRHILGSAKCQVLAELLPSLKRDGHRVLIFSQWTTMLDVLESALDVIGVTYSRLDGSTQVTERQTIVDNFNNDSSIFACLLSTRAGGQGLNLTGADTVIIHDMDFNPQIDRQAEDRCHRIGQTRPVTVYRLVTKGTVDENIFAIAKRKLTLDAAVLESDVELENDNDTMEKTMAEILSSILMG